MWNWWQINEHNDYTHTLKDRKRDAKVFNERLAQLAFRECYKEFINTFGMDERYKEYITKCVELEILEIELAQGDRSKKTFITMAKIDLQDMTLGMQKQAFNHVFYSVQKQVPMRIDLQTMPTYDFYALVKGIEEEYKQQKAQMNNGK